MTDKAVVAQIYRGKDWPSLAEAKKARDQQARALRQQGYTVECKKWDFTDLARDIAFTLLAYRNTPPIVSPSFNIVTPYGTF